ncbi:hypothetical protein HU200_019425 [Digitaria exilis]|uniref:Cytochrome P450 n=1 Tax=Digitaria exilis TaxID=1010633 RepID=A0A835F382_9POAL|nr:hypothetical protein HU200_019425 [Digitaria exilis]
MDDAMHRVEAASACQSHSLLLPPPTAAGAGTCYLVVSLITAFLCLLAASSAIYYCLCTAIVSSNKQTKRRDDPNTETTKKKSKHRDDDDGGDNAPRVPPGRSESWWWSVVETLAFVSANGSGRGFYDFVSARHRRHGGLGFRTALFGRTHVFVSSPGAARSLLAAEPAGFSKRYVRTVADLLGDHSLLSASHAAHRSLRRAVAPLFSNARSTSSFASAFDSLTRRLMLDWSSSGCGGAVVVLDAALGVTFEAICGMLVATLPGDARRRMQGDVLAVTRAMLAFPIRLPGTRFHAGLRARERIMEVLRGEIASRRQDGGGEDDMDFLQSLLVRSQQQQQSDNDEAPLTDEQILDNILTLIIAVGSAGAGAQGSGFPAYDSASQRHGARIQGFHISKGWIVNIDARSMHYDPKIYDNPTTFDPSRFNGEDTKQPYSYLVFGAGGRTCLGMNLAKIMMLIFLHRLVTTFRWEMADDDTSLEKWAMFPRLKNGCPIHLTPI